MLSGIMRKGWYTVQTGNILDEAVRFIAELYQGNSDGHGFDHSMRVYRSALLIAEAEESCDRETVALAALLHDADDYKLFSTENNANARAFLTAHQVPPERIETKCAAINSVSFSKNRGKRPGSVEGQIVQDADRLDAIGAIGVARTFAYGGGHGRTLEESVRHFHEKLLLLKDLMNTSKAREMAESRHLFMLSFLAEWEKENATQAPVPPAAGLQHRTGSSQESD